MNKTLTLAVAAAIGCASVNAEAQTMIGKTTDVAAISKGDRMTPETLWAMGRIGGAAASPDGKTIAYQVGYYSVKENKNNPKKLSGLAARLQAMQEQQQELQRKREELERKRKGL